MSRGHVQEKKDAAGSTIAWRAVINHPTKLTRNGQAKRLTKQFAVTKPAGAKTGTGLTSKQAEKAAYDWLDVTRHAFREGREISGKTVFSVSNAADAWLNAIAVESQNGSGKLRDSTLDYYNYIVRCYIHEPPAGAVDIGALRLSQLEPASIDQWSRDLISCVSRSAARRSLMVMKAILSLAVLKGWLSSNPAAELKLGTERHEDGSINIVLEREHVVILLKTARALAEKGWINTAPTTGRERKAAANRRRSWAKWYPFFRVAFSSGGRTGECLAARGYDFEIEGFFRIERTLSKKGKIEAPKTSRGKRAVAIDPEAMRSVRALIVKRELKPGAYVFGTSSGRCDSLSNVRRAWGSLLRIANGVLPQGVEPLIIPDGTEDGMTITSPYHSRHYHASELLRVGVTLADVSERLGHRDTVITQRHYAHLLGDRSAASREASDKFAAALGECVAT